MIDKFFANPISEKSYILFDEIELAMEIAFVHGSTVELMQMHVRAACPTANQLALSLTTDSVEDLK